MTERTEVHPDFADFMIRVEEALSDESISGKLGKWIPDNTFLNNEPFTYKDHEYQEAIANDTHPDMVVKKCSQVGLSELCVRIALGLIALRTMTAIYTLPSAGFAGTFSKSRIHVVIEQSPKLAALTRPGAMSVGLIQLVNSFLHIKGAATMTQAISVPADALLNDEYDFSNQGVLTAFESRLRHAENGGIRKKFSTPTVEGFGVSAIYDRSDRKRYLCKCVKCNFWQAVDFTRQIIIPGFDKKFEDFSKEDLHEESINVAGAWIACLKCRNDLWSSLMNPACREWVAEMPSRTGISGWEVSPLDVPKYNAVPKILEQFGKYDRLQDFYNFVLGRPHSSHQNQIDTTVVDACTRGSWMASGSGFMMGVDVGKHRLHVIIGKRVRDRYAVVAIYVLTERDGPFREQLKKLYRQYGCVRAVIDSQPDITICKQFRTDCVNVYPSIYIKNKVGKISKYWDLDEKQHAIQVQRTRGLDSLVEVVNGQQWEWPVCNEMSEVKEHLKQMKRVEERDEEDKKIEKWVKVSETDHFFHASMYFKAACDMDDKDIGEEVVSGPLSVTGVSIGSGRVSTDTSIHAALDVQTRMRQLVARFGVR